MKIVKTEAEAADLAFSGEIRRPCLARDGKGQLVVCSRRTIREKGWKLEGTLFVRDRKAEATVGVSK
jgi:hypothetical protein